MTGNELDDASGNVGIYWWIVWIGGLFVKCMVYYGNFSFLCALVAVRQEVKVWQSTSTPMNVLGMIKCYLLNVSWMWGCWLGFWILLPTWIVRYFLGKRGEDFSVMVTREAHGVIEYCVSRCMIWCFIGRTVRTVGTEHLPEAAGNENGGVSVKPAPVFAANHSTTIDAPAIYFSLNARHPRLTDGSYFHIRNHLSFKWTAKSSIRLLPGVGFVMWLSDHISIQRRKPSKNNSTSTSTATKKSGTNTTTSTNPLYEMASNVLCQHGIPIFLFPQGTRRLAERLPFKDGAFRIASADSAPIIPISIHTPPNAWNTLYPFVPSQQSILTITIHPPIPTKPTDDIQKLKQICSDTIYSVLPTVPLASPTTSHDTKNKDIEKDKIS